MTIVRTVLYLLALLVLPSYALALKIDRTEFTLANGMRAIVIPDHRAPIVTQMVWYKIGSADENTGQTGLAHFLEHLMFKGTAKYPTGEFDRLLRLNGGEGNAFTSRDATVYFQKIAADRLPLIMELEADRMHNLFLTDDNVLPERDVVREERRQRTENDPQSLLGEQADAILYAAHPYGRPVVGWMADVERLTLEDAMAFYKAHYTPANATLVVAGDVTPEQVKELAERYYGPLPNTADAKERWRTPEPDPLAARRIDMTDPRVTSQMIQRVYLGPSFRTAPLREVLALGLLADIIGSGPQSRLYQALVVDQKIAAGAGSGYNAMQRDSAQFYIYALPTGEHSLAEVEHGVDIVLQNLMEKGVTQAELDRARNRSRAEDIYDLDNINSIAQEAGLAAVIGVSLDTVLDSNDELSKVTVEDVNAAARKWLTPNRSVTATLSPADAKPPEQNVNQN